jgi:cytochrome bd ubiquinol oxidase subunit II
METLWFVILALMLIAYVVLDGFDLGAGIISRLVAKNAGERRIVLRAIGPVWDGNEVWLIAAGGVMVLAFPVLYAVSFSGFYLPLMMVLWLLMLRGISIELRSHIEDPLWQSFWDFVFTVASTLLAVFFGAALGNVIRGVPITSEKYFFAPLWTNFRTGPEPGILDWYTVLTGVVAVVGLMVHGANYIAARTSGEVNQRARALVARAWWALVLMTIVSFVATIRVRPDVTHAFLTRPWGLVIPVCVAVSLISINVFQRRGREWAAFLGSAFYLAGMLGGAAFALYPRVLPAINPEFNLTIFNASAGSYGLKVAAWWWSFGILLAIGYFVYLYRSFRGKVTSLQGEGY